MRRSAAAALLDSVAQASRSIRSHPLRATLAAVAMAAAVATTAVVQAGLDGLAESARAASARAFGTDSFVIAKVAAGGLTRRELADRIARNPDITRSDVRFLDRVAGNRVVYAAITQRSGDVIASGRKFENASINGTEAALFDIRDVGIARGRPFTHDEDVSGAQVIVAGASVVQELFPGADPLGRTVRIAGRQFRIVGVQGQQGSAGGLSLDRYIWMPIAAFERAFGAPPSVQVFARAAGAARVDAAEDHARISMRARRHLPPWAPDTFDIVTPEASRSFVDTITERLGAAGPPITLMALIAAIVVVTNTILVSVTERTHEIGVRRAVGAAARDILAETLSESSIIALVGGALGLAVAAIAVLFASPLVGFPLALGGRTAVVSLAAAGLSGVAAGWYPARRAARLDIVNALRQE